MPLYVIDPSIYYWADPSGLSGGDSAGVIDNSTYTMSVNHIGDYDIEVFAWDGYNVLYHNNLREPHNVYIQNPIIYTLTDKRLDYPLDLSTMSINDVSTLISQNTLPIYDRDTEHVGLTLEYDASNNVYINIPSVSYFQNVPEVGSITKYFIGSENITNISGNTVTINKLYENFKADDDIMLIKFYKGSYMSIYEASSYITSVNLAGDELTLDNIPSEIVLDISHNIYAINVTESSTYNIINDTSTSLTIDVSNHFLDNQMVALIIDDSVYNYTWGSSYRVLDSSVTQDASWGYHHTLKGTMSDFLLNNDRYNITARHAYGTFVNYELLPTSSLETSNNFKLYQDDDRQYYLDDTFVMININFSQDYVNDQWYDPSLNLVTTPYYIKYEAIDIEVDKLVVLNILYDPSVYLLNQKNIWTIKENISKNTVLRVFNKNVPFVFDTLGYYDVIAESYDTYGNLASKTYEGLIHVI